MIWQVAAFSGVEALTYCVMNNHLGRSSASEHVLLRVPKSTVLRCRVCDFTDGAILGSEEFVRGFVGVWQMDRGRKYPPKVNSLLGTDWVGSNHDSRPQAANWIFGIIIPG
jgi:hypothetical protein